MDVQLPDGSQSDGAAPRISSKHKIRYLEWIKGFNKNIEIIIGVGTLIPKVEPASGTRSEYTSEADCSYVSKDDDSDSDLEIISEIIKSPLSYDELGTQPPVQGNTVISYSRKGSTSSPVMPRTPHVGAVPTETSNTVPNQLDFRTTKEPQSNVTSSENVPQPANISPRKLEESEILEKAFAKLKEVTATFFEGPDGTWMTKEDLKVNWQIKIQGVLDAWTADYGDQITSLMLKLFNSFVDVQHTKIQSTNEVNKQTFEIVKDEFEKRFQNVEKGFSHEWLKKSKGDIIAMYSKDDTHGFQLVLSLGELASSYYRKFKLKNVEVLFDLAQKLRAYESNMCELLEKCVCCAENADLDGFHCLVFQATGLHQLNTSEHLVKKSEEIVETIRSSQREKNILAIENETVIAKKAVNYAVNRHSDIIKSMLDTNASRLKAERDEITTAVVKSFFEVPDFFYTHLWNNERDELTSRLERNCTELLKKYESDKVDQNLTQKQIQLFETIVDNYFNEVDQGIALKGDIRSRRWRVECAIKELKAIAAENLAKLEKRHESKDCSLIMSTLQLRFNKIIENYTERANGNIDDHPSSTSVTPTAEPLSSTIIEVT